MNYYNLKMKKTGHGTHGTNGVTEHIAFPYSWWRSQFSWWRQHVTPVREFTWNAFTIFADLGFPWLE